MKQQSGFSLVDLLKTLIIIAVIIYANPFMRQDRFHSYSDRDKALADLKQICNVLADYDSELPEGITTYTDISENVRLRDINKLVEARKMTDVPDDPWGNIYRIDIEAGIIYSQGPDFKDSFDYYRYTVDNSHIPPLPLSVEQSIYAAKDDVIVRFRPSFRPAQAKVVNTIRDGKEVSVVSVMFTRPVIQTFLTTDSSFVLSDPLDAIKAPEITTTVVNVLKRHEVSMILMDKLETLESPSRYWTISAMNDNSIRSTDTTTIEKIVTIDVIPSEKY